jgi:RNA polymerase sigma factor (TIGR02999 family)
MKNVGKLTPEEIDSLFTLTYEELRRMARTVKQGDRSATLNPTALVNEAWMRLRASGGVEAESAGHFKRIAARAMRQILVEAARRRQAGKRGGDGVTVALAAEAGEVAPVAHEVLALEQALDELAKLDARQAQLVEARFYGGMDIGELTEAFQISEATVMRDWRMARAWLASRLGAGGSQAGR